MQRSVAGADLDFRIALPASWIRLDLDPRSRRESVRDLAHGQLGEDPQHAELRRQFEALALKAAEEAEQAGAEKAWFYADRLGDRPVIASLVARWWQADGDRSSHAMIERLNASSRPGNLVVVAEMRELGSGPAIRVRRRVTTRRPETGDRDMTAESVQYYVSVPRVPEFLVLAFSTPNLALVEAFLELFEAIVGTLQWFARAEEAE